MAMEVAGAVRNAYNAEGRMFVVAGQTLFQITPGGVSVPLGTIPGTGRVSFSHNQITNGNEVLINNGNAGYIYNTVTQVLTRITDTSYPGGLRAAFLNNRLIQIEPKRRYAFPSGLADGLDYNALDRFTSEVSPDLLVGLEVSNNELLLFSTSTGEFYEDTGANPQPIRSKQIVMQRGMAGPYASATLDNTIFFLGDDGCFYRLEGYHPVRISTKPIEQSIRGKNWWNCFTTIWQDSGYKVCYWTFPDGLTWGFDVSTGKWHRRESYGFNRWRINSLTYWQNKWYGGDFQAGKLYELDWDYILEGDQEFVSYRSAGVISDNQNRVIHERLELVVNTGMQETVPVEFADQPEGPTLTGEAPDGPSGRPYSFSYTATPGGAPIARTVLRGTVLPDGWSWNQATATISATAPTITTITLSLRTYDTNGLYADHEDSFIISQNYTLLVSGSPVSLGQPVICTTESLGDIEFVGIAQSTGADISGGIVAQYDGTWALVNQSAVRYTTDPVDTWSTGTISASRPVEAVIPGAGGWLVTAGDDFPCEKHWGATPASFALTDPQTANPAKQSALDSTYRAWRAGDLYFLMYPRTLFTTDLPGDEEYDLSYDVLSSPNEDPLLTGFFDIILQDGVYIAAARTYGYDWQIRTTETLSSWSDDNILASGAISDGHCPYELCAVPISDTETAYVALCFGGGVRCSTNNWEWIDIGLDAPSGGIGEPETVPGGRRMAVAGNVVFIIGYDETGNLCKRFNPATLEVSDPYTLPITNAVSIAAREA